MMATKKGRRKMATPVKAKMPAKAKPTSTAPSADFHGSNPGVSGGTPAPYTKPVVGGAPTGTLETVPPKATMGQMNPSMGPTSGGSVGAKKTMAGKFTAQPTGKKTAVGSKPPAKPTGKANAVTRGKGKKVGLHKTVVSKPAVRKATGFSPAKPAARGGATGGSNIAKKK
jgi:hypothetical protein